MHKLFSGILLASVSPFAFAGVINGQILVPHSVPAISQPGLIALAFIVGIVGARLIRKLKAVKA